MVSHHSADRLICSLKPISIKQLSRDKLLLLWDDGHESPISVQALRDACPCAGCKGETVLFRTYVPPEPDGAAPGRNELKNASPVGYYALKLMWGDGHDMGIYPWELLRSLCECEDCLAGRSY